MAAPLHNFTHGAFDEKALWEMMSEEGFAEALAGCSNLLAACFVESPKAPEFHRAFEVVCSMVCAGEWPFGSAESLEHAKSLLAQAQREDHAAQVAAYTRLFRGPAKLPAPPWGSVYMDRDQVMYGWTWVELRSWMRMHGFAGTYEENDPEDHFGRMLALLGAIVQSKPLLAGEFLADHLLCWSAHFLDKLAESAESSTYEALSALAAATLDDVASLLGVVPARRRFYR